MSMDSGNTPTQYPRRDQPFLEATEPVSNGTINFYVDYVNPYEHTELYHQSLPLVPPPPPEQKKNMGWSGIALLCLVGLLLVGSVVSIGINGAPWQQAQTTTHSPVPIMISTAAVTPTPGSLPTATPTPTPGVHTPIITGAKAPYPASQIVGYFYQAGLAPQTTTIDTSWSCCQYYPEGGAAYWSDLQNRHHDGPCNFRKYRRSPDGWSKSFK